MIEYTIYTDGACSGNPGPGGWGFVVVDSNNKKLLNKNGGEKLTTNNRMELTAFLNALEWFDSNRHKDDILNIYVDSAYVYNCFNDMWYVRWRKNGWKNANKQPIANREIWEQILNLFLENIEHINIFKVTGHNGNKWNEYVDGLAVKAAKEITNDY